MQYTGLPLMARSYDRKGKAKPLLDEAFTFDLPGKKSLLTDRIAMLGLPEEDLTEPVALALSALFERLDDGSLELKQAREQLKELESLVDVDTLAPIPNRRAFMRRLQWVIAMHDRYGHPSSIVYFDLNGFKEMNDTYGHAAGDMAIRHVADILEKGKRESDFLARLGGDEFAVIMYYAESEPARKRGLEIAERIKNTPFSFNGRSLALTTAVGVHAIMKGETPEQAMHAADAAMYAHKKRLRGELTGASA